MEWEGPMTTRGPVPSPRKGHTVTRLLDSSLVLVFGGESESSGKTNDMYSLHVDRGEWRQIKYADGPVPAPRLLHSATAISSTAMVVMYGDGDSGAGPRDDEAMPGTSLLDVWLFDIRNCAWKEIRSKGDSPPRARSCHSAVFGNGFGQVPAIYLYGGFGVGVSDAGPVYRLRIGDWTWECLSVVVTDSNNKQTVEAKPSRRVKGKDGGNAAPEEVPCERESHGAIWLPALNGMLVVGGDGGYILDDCWLFVPSSRRTAAWRWRKLRFRMARGLIKNKLPACAGISMVALPTEKPQVLLWGGILGPEGQNPMDANCAYLIDLDAKQTTQLRTRGELAPASRLLHGLVRANDKLYLFGGCDTTGRVIPGLHSARLLPELKSVGLQATDFGPVAAELAAGEPGRLASASARSRVCKEAEKDAMKWERSIPLMGPSTIPKGTPLSGRIIEKADFGYFVSVVINGKLYKGVLVANPLKDSQATSKGNLTGTNPENSGNGDGNLRESPEPKRIRLDPAAENLPDSPQKPKSLAKGVIIDLE